MNRWLALILMPLVPLPWLYMKFSGPHGDPAVIALLSGVAIFAAAFILSWASEVAQLDIPPTLAIAALALIAVLPEYAIDMLFAWKAGKDPVYAHYAVANMTGANRLIIGLAWSLVVLLHWWKTKKTSVKLEASHVNPLVILLLATLYSFIIPLKRAISLFDGAVLFVLFVVYIAMAMRAKVEEPELEGPPAVLSLAPRTLRRLITAALFLYSGFVIFISAEPFSESLLHMGKTYGIEEFLLVQWLAPLASESPEFIVAAIFALKGSASTGMGALVSSKVNQWTLLVGLLPVAYCLSAGSTQALPMDARQVEEVFLTSAQSLFAVVVLLDRRVTFFEAFMLFSLFITQLFINTPHSRHLFAFVYLALAAVVFLGQLRAGGYRWTGALLRLRRRS